ncbi:hypothetical protein [Marinobacter orientalis]|uniref:Uncharacterized protein n=1 Tax=Marinobacter orientalis TaxID=1928859 RepID=A0A7Y0RCD7_9GAMM|nr:hypothetical protein [Marinobacter orientalis]NMT63651.1 hypothetical protein [Marinobacter orientalis]TGX49766.1 hypothetical protein DIT72_08585 [Marinobacter orientalis]
MTKSVFDDGGSAEGITYLSPTGKYASAFDVDDITFGSISFDGSSISGSGTDYILFDSWELTTGSLTGTVTSSESASLTASAEGFNSDITLQRENTFSDRGVTLEAVSGTYTMDEAGFYTSSVTISSDGSVTGSDETGCVFNGTLTIPDTAINIFEVTYTASNCGDTTIATGSERDGSFAGVGAYDPSLGEISFAGRNGVVAGLFIGLR